MEEVFEIELKYPVPSVCRACLSTDRKLSPLGELEEIYQKLCVGWDTTGMLLCWECLALLRKVKIFINNVQTAQTVLNCHGNIYPEATLSSLRQNTLHCLYSFDHSHQSLEDDHIRDDHEIDLNIKEEQDFKTDSTEETIKPEGICAEVTNNINYTKAIYTKEVKISENDMYETNYLSDNDVNDEITCTLSMDLSRTKSLSSNDLKLKSKNKSKKLAKVSNKQKKNQQSFREKLLKKRSMIYKIINGNVSGKTSYSVPVLDRKEVEKLMDEDRKYILGNRYYKLRSKCLLCLSHIKRGQKDKHELDHHTQTADKQYSCDICPWYANNKSLLRDHITEHFTKRFCKICQFECYSISHMKNHTWSHRKSAQCMVCHAVFRRVPEFYEHYNKMHFLYSCDYCQRSFGIKEDLERHIKKLHLKRFNCIDCKKCFMNRRYYLCHMSNKHHKNPQESYCVTCNRQFDTIHQYRSHLKSAKVHLVEMGKEIVKKVIPCPECSKVFSRNYVMQDHFNFFHAGIFNYQCDLCGKNFSRKFRLDHHRKTVHENYKPPKDKICNECGRGFANNRILQNHIRTHTGERPFKCGYCDAAFAQATAMKTHEKSIHLKLKRNPTNNL